MHFLLLHDVSHDDTQKSVSNTFRASQFENLLDLRSGVLKTRIYQVYPLQVNCGMGVAEAEQIEPSGHSAESQRYLIA